MLMMRNFTQHYPDVLAVAKNEAERHAVYRGVIKGAVYSQPAAISHAVENVDPGFTSTEEERNTLSTYILRWTEQDASAVSSWLKSTAVVMKAFSAEGIQVRKITSWLLVKMSSTCTFMRFPVTGTMTARPPTMKPFRLWKEPFRRRS